MPGTRNQHVDVELENIYGMEPLDPAAVADEMLAYAPKLSPYVTDTVSGF